jgi:citrate synthase
MAEATIRGLENVVAAFTALADIDGTAGMLRYCGYDIHELVNVPSFEAIVWLLWNGELPASESLSTFSHDLQARRSISSTAYDVLKHVPQATAPIDALRTVISSMATDEMPLERAGMEAARASAVTLLAQMPVILAGFGRLRQGKQPVAPRSDLGHAANLLWMYHGVEPRPVETDALARYMILLAEHSLNASTFAARVVIGAGGDVYGAITAALAALKGNAHGGANQKAYEMLEAIGSPARVTEYVDEALAARRRIMGIGHRIYRVEDPRVRHLRVASERLIAAGAGETIHRTAEALLGLTAAHPYFAERRLAPNVEFFSAPLLGALGFPADMFPALFACSRIAGWSAHISEQLKDNRLIRPKAAYIGPSPRSLSLL